MKSRYSITIAVSKKRRSYSARLKFLFHLIRVQNRYYYKLNVPQNTCESNEYLGTSGNSYIKILAWEGIKSFFY